MTIDKKTEEKTNGDITEEKTRTEEKTNGGEEKTNGGETEATEEKTRTEEKTNDETIKMAETSKEDIIDNYIDHIRNISELTDVEIALAIDDTIDEDEEFLDILEKFLSRGEKIDEKIEFIKEDRDEKEDKDKDERREEIDDILDAFDDADYAYPLEEIIQSLRDSGYPDPGTTIVDAINDGILCMDSIDEDDVTYITLTKEGESLWKSHNT